MKYTTESELYQAVIALLARRDYSEYEIRQKYQSLCHPEHLQQVLSRCQEAGYQSDQRFTAVYIRSKASQGYGWNRIRQELHRRGIPQALMQNTLDQEEPDWFEACFELASRKFSGRIDPKDFKLHQKQLRYLVNRGFDYEQARTALARCKESII